MPLIISHSICSSSQLHRIRLPHKREQYQYQYHHSSSPSSLPNHRFRGSRLTTTSKRDQLTQNIPYVSPEKSVSVSNDEEPQSIQLSNAADVVRNFYGGINRHELDAVEDLIAENCVYEDLVFPQPFIGRKAILDFFKQFIESCNRDLQFVIDDISEVDQSAVGVTWHLEWKGKPFPFSKGCSFYRLQVSNGLRQIIYARDSVEPAIKPGESTLVAIRGVTWLLQQFPKLADFF